MALNAKDLVYSNSDVGLQAGGFNINSHLLQNNLSAVRVNSNSNCNGKHKQKGGGLLQVGSVLDGLAVPAGLLYLQQNYKQSNSNNSEGSTTSSIFDKLVSLASQKERSVTKKNKRSLFKSTSNTQKNKTKTNKTKRNLSSLKKNKTKRK